MGNKPSTKEINKILFYDDFDKPDIYGLIGKKGNGKLVELAILAHRTKDYSRLDEFIKTECVKFLINSGKGEFIPFEDINELRFKYEIESTKQKRKWDLFFGRKKQEEFQIESHSKIVCFDLYQRGYNGETLLHLCLLNNSFIHDLIAKRLINFFPNMVKDICIGDEHFGETALHMAIVNDDPRMMKLLLDRGSDIHQRCTGKFFIPDDQKEKRKNFLLNEIPTLPIETNYNGLSYFGEYPLNFAAVLDHEDCVRLLLAKGANPNKQDSNGNTILHLLVIHNNMRLFKLLVEHNADLNIKNKQDFTPLTLATELCRQEIFFYILETIREVYWVYADISCAAYPLKNIDTISQNGKIDTKSVLYLILEKDTGEHLKLMEGCLTNLLQKKWTTFVKFRFYVEVFIFALFFIFNAVVIFLKRSYYDDLQQRNFTIDSKGNRLLNSYKCAYLDPVDAHYPRTIIEIIVILYTIFYLLLTLNDLYINGWKLFLCTMLRNPTKMIFLIALFCILAIIPFRIACNTAVEDNLIALEVILLSFAALYYARGFRVVCNFVYNLHRIIGHDMVRFCSIYFIFMISFSQSFFLILQKLNPYLVMPKFIDPFESIIDTIVLTLGEVTVAYESLKFSSSYAIIGGIYTMVFMLLGSLLLINMLIAMMNRTQEITNERSTEWVRQWGRQILAVEQNINSKERLKQQIKYSNCMESGEKALIVKWKQNNEERNEFKSKKEIFQKQIFKNYFKYD